MNRNRNPKASHVRWLSATVLVVVLMLGMAPGVGAAGAVVCVNHRQRR